MNPEKVLPPGVNGKITGYLMVKVDEIFWARNSPGDVIVQLQWWGEKDSTLFKPEDITVNESKKTTNTSVTYSIKTSHGLFESYLRNCGKITFTVLRGQNQNVVLGAAVVKEVEQILSLKNYHSYFPVFSPKGNRIGDLHICFELTFKHHGTHLSSKCNEQSYKAKPETFKKTIDVEDQSSNAKCEQSNSQEEKLLSNVLQKGYNLRKAMVMSVLADCPIDNLETIINYNSHPVAQHPNKEEAKLVDFLLGKQMTAEEELKALKTLRCISPAENLVEIAKTDGKTTQVIKSKCCLHGQECCKESTNAETVERKLTPVLIETNSVSSLKTVAKSEEGVEDIEDEMIVKKKKEIKFNCYRITISSLKLTADGSRKIFYVPGHNHNPPGTCFILEITFPSKDKGAWSRSIKFMTRDFRGHTVGFHQGTTHRLCGSVTWTRIRTLVTGSVFTVYWRHLNQRLPCPLGSTKLEQFIPEHGANSVSLCLPVYSNTRLLTGHINVIISLGMLKNLKDEAVFHTEKKTERSYEELDGLSSKASLNMFDEPAIDGLSENKSVKVPKEPTVNSIKSASPVASDSDVFPAPSLDEELMKTIDLLNSKSDDIVKKNPDIERQEACVQTTLPFTPSECPKCHCQKPNGKNPADDIPENINSVREKPGKHFEGRNGLKVTHIDRRPERFSEFDKNISSTRSNIHKDNFHSNVKFPCENQYSEISHLPVEFENKIIHEFTVRIEKVVGIPMFTGDNDLDCYVDYSFPKVDHNSKMVFDHVPNGTDVRMALRVTEFGTVMRHKLRLNCKLTKALLSLPDHEIIFSVWGRYYRPTPRDYKLGKATLPLMKLSTLELVYCQQRKREPIFEKIVIPISVVESSVTSGYKGPFGDLHIILGYSCASGTSYREWREDRYYFSYPNTSRDLNKNESNYINPSFDIHHNFNYCKDQDNRNYMFPDKMKPSSQSTLNSRINTRNGFVNSPIQSNFNHQTIYDSKIRDGRKPDEMQDVQYKVSKETKRKRIQQSTEHNCVDKILDVKELHCIDTNQPREYNHFDKKTQIVAEPSHLGSVVEEVLSDMKERQNDNCRKPKSTVHTITAHPQNVTPPTELGASGDAFESFDLKVDLPVGQESVDFEARSQYSFLYSPPPIPCIPNQQCNVILESDSSSSIKDRIQKDNPFSSLSNVSFSLNSESSMFKVQGNDNQHCHNKNGNNLEKKISSVGEKVDVGEFSSLSDKMYGRASPNVNNAKTYHHKRVQKNSIINIDSEKDKESNNSTLKSVESLKSYKEELEGRESKDIGVETEFFTQHKDTQTSYTSYREEQCFKARVQICRALGLPSVEVRQSNGKIGLVKPTSYAYFSAMIKGKPTILRTEVVEKKSNPIWNASWDVELPVDFLKKCDRELEIFVDLSGGNEEPARGSDCSSHWPIVLRTGVDLTPITAGLEHASGFFSLADRALLSRAQLKVIVTPLEEVKCFRDDWLKEYTKAKGRKIDFNRPHSSSIATSLQEKLKELEKLTERMRNKMDDRPNWNKSPPFELLSEMQAVRFSQDQIGLQPVESRWLGTVERAEKATSPIILNSLESSHCSPVINIDDEEDEKSVVQTYTVDVGSESSQNDSLETPSETIDRILTKMRSKR